MTRFRSVPSRGAIAGILGATILALWFLIIDWIEGRPLYTPSFLAAGLAGLDTVEITFTRVLLYTTLHYLAFIAIGIGVTALLRKLETAPSFLLGAVLGFFLFNVVFYTSVAVTGIDVVAVLGWPEVLMGNLLAGIVMMGYLHLTQEVKAISWWEALKQHTIIREGLFAGLLGAAAVAVWFLIIDLITARVFFTPAALGSAVLFGARDLAEVQVTAATVLGYSLLHGAAFITAGIVAAAVVHQAEETPPLLLGFVLLTVTFGTLIVGLIAIVAEWILQALAWWSIMIGTLLGAGAMGVYLWRSHPVIQEHVREARRDPVELEEPV
jgi:hypothetical protein